MCVGGGVGVFMSLFCYVVICVLSSFATISLGKRGLDALLLLNTYILEIQLFWTAHHYQVNLDKVKNHVALSIGQFIRPRGYKTFSYSTQLNRKFIRLINVKMPTIVGILTLISMINTTYERLKARNFVIRRYFSFHEQLKLRAQLS